MNNLDTILQNTYSLSQLKARLTLLKNHLLKQVFAGPAQMLTADESSYLKSLPDDFYKNFTKDNINQIFTQFSGQISNLPTLILYLTFEPDEQTIEQIGSYARKTFGSSRGAGKMILLDIKYDSKLIAGAALVWNGLYRDYSLRSKIEERKMVILESFKKFLR